MIQELSAIYLKYVEMITNICWNGHSEILNWQFNTENTENMWNAYYKYWKYDEMLTTNMLTNMNIKTLKIYNL